MSWGIVAVVAVVVSTVYSQISAKAAAKKSAAKGKANAGTLITAREPAAQRRIIYGRRRVGGTYAYMGSTDTAGGAVNEWMHLVIALAGHEVQSIGDVYFEDALVPLDGSGNCVSGNYAGLVRIKKHLGSPTQTADTDLIAESGGKWTSAHRLQGVAYIYVRLKYDATKLGQIPNITVVVEGKKLYDPRTATTAYSTNPALALRDFLTDTDYGLGVAGDELNDATFITGAALCDETVALAAGGTEPRYTVGGCFERDETPDKVLGELAGSMSASVVCTGGQWYLVGGCYRAPSATFTIDDVRGQIVIQSKESRSATANAIKGTYFSEANKWQPADYPPVKNATYMAQDGERIWREEDFNYTPSSATAQRLAKIELEKTRQEITLKLPVKLQGLRVQAGDTVAVTIARYGWSAKVFEVIGWQLVLEDGAGDGGGKILGVDLDLRETASGVWDWNNGLETTVDLAPNTNLPDPRGVAAPTNLTVVSDVQKNADGSASGRLLVTWIASVDAFARGTGGKVEVQFKQAAASDWIAASSVSGATERTVIGGVASGVSYLVRIRAANPSGVASDWVQVGSSVTATGDTTAPGTPYGAAVVGLYQGMRITWSNPSDPDLSYVEVYEAASAGASPNGASTGLARVAGTDYVRSGLGNALTKYYWLRSVDVSGNASAWVYAGTGTTTYIEKTSIPDWSTVDDIETALGTVQTTLASVSGTASAAATTAATANSGVDSLKAEYVLNVVTNGGGAHRVAGFRVTNQGGAGGGTDFVIQADKFAVVNASGDGQLAPFQVEGGVVYMNSAMIRNLTADSITVRSLKVSNQQGAVAVFSPRNRLDNDISITHNLTWRVDSDGYIEIDYSEGQNADYSYMAFFYYELLLDLNVGDSIIFYGSGYCSENCAQVVSTDPDNGRLKITRPLSGTIPSVAPSVWWTHNGEVYFVTLGSSSSNVSSAFYSKGQDAIVINFATELPGGALDYQILSNYGAWHTTTYNPPALVSEKILSARGVAFNSWNEDVMCKSNRSAMFRLDGVQPRYGMISLLKI